MICIVRTLLHYICSWLRSEGHRDTTGMVCFPHNVDHETLQITAHLCKHSLMECNSYIYVYIHLATSLVSWLVPKTTWKNNDFFFCCFKFSTYGVRASFILCYFVIFHLIFFYTILELYDYFNYGRKFDEFSFLFIEIS